MLTAAGRFDALVISDRLNLVCKRLPLCVGKCVLTLSSAGETTNVKVNHLASCIVSKGGHPFFLFYAVVEAVRWGLQLAVLIVRVYDCVICGGVGWHELRLR